MAKKANKKAVEAPKGLTVQVKVNEAQKLNGTRITFTVTLLQDGVQISSDSDFVTISND